MKVTMKNSTEKLARQVALMKVLNMGLNPDDPDYDKYFKKFFNLYCKEAVMHSMTPSGELKANPIAGAVKSVFTFDDMIEKSFRGDNKTKQILKHQVNSAAQSLVSAFMQIHFDVQSKSTKDKKSDLVFNESGAEAMLDVEIHRYISYMTTGLMFGYLEKFFKQDVRQLPEIFQEALPKDTNGAISLRSLRNKGNRLSFGRKFLKIGRNFIMK